MDPLFALVAVLVAAGLGVIWRLGLHWCRVGQRLRRWRRPDQSIGTTWRSIAHWRFRNETEALFVSTAKALARPLSQ